MPPALSATAGLIFRPEGLPAPGVFLAQPRPTFVAAPADTFVTAPPRSGFKPIILPSTLSTPIGTGGVDVRAWRELAKALPSSVVQAWNSLPQPSTTANVRAVHDNNESWLCAWNILSRAHEKVDASYFIMRRDVFGYAYLGMLLRKRLEGAKVNLLLDATGDTAGFIGFTEPLLGRDYLQELANAGANVKIYNPYYKKLPRQLAHPTSSLGISANHDKILATETYGMTGGRNIAGEYFSSPDDYKNPFRDSDIVVEGDEAARHLAAAMHAEFDRDDLNEQVNPDLFGNWMRRDAELLGTAAMMDAWLNMPPIDDTTRQLLRDSPEVRERYAEQLVDAAKQDLARRNIDMPWGCESKLLKHARELAGNPTLAGSNRQFDLNDTMVQGDVKALDRTSVGSMPQGHDEIDPGLEQLLRGARRTIYITNPYIMLSERVIKRLEEAGKRGVHIMLLTDSPTTSDDPLPQGFFLREWPKLLQRVPNMRIFVFDGDQQLHAKTAVADGAVTAIGSFNLDILSSHINGEIVETVHSREFAQKLVRQFWTDLRDPRNHAHEYTIAHAPSGEPLLRDGKPVITYGPANHIAPEKLTKFKFWMPFTELLENLPQLAPLRADK